MGVPSFYRWLVNKYPKIVADAAAAAGGGGSSPEFDNLYLDMNALIHPCFHPDDHPFPPTTVDEVFQGIHDYIDNLFEIVKPRKLLFMAMDGVAPRAKMNQQRARRFCSARDAEIAADLEERLRKEFEAEGKIVLPKEESVLSDSNVITPGTEFMHKLSENLRSYVKQRLNENPAWQNVKVILSDDKSPGEGEHKILSFIRAQRASSGYDPNTRHCLYGLDADLIMLALATHELHFSILREEVLPLWQLSRSEPVIDTAQSGSSQGDRFRASKRQSYEFVNVSLMREYLALDMEIPNFDKFEFDLERVIDDFIFICFFAGNDFLPHIASLEIHEGCIDLLMDVYKKEFQNLGGYLVDMEKVDDKEGAYINLSRVERFILVVGSYEEKIFSKRAHIRDKILSRILAKEDEKACRDEGTSLDVIGMHDISHFDKLKISAPAVDTDTVLENTKELKQKVKEIIRNQSDRYKDGSFGTDKVRFGTPGWRERYYKEKLSAEKQMDMELKRKSLVENFGEGLCWVLQYYFSEVPSWKWFYPYHYGPFASDFRGLSGLTVKFEKDSPFKPFDQLMAVLPPRSSHALPLPYKRLMVDEKSKIIDFYPTEFEVDVDGKRLLWQAKTKLDFIDEERLLTETRKAEAELKDEERSRNVEAPHRLFMRRSSKLRQQLSCCRESKDTEKIEGAISIDSEIEGIKGTLHVTREDLIESDDEKRYQCSTDAICMFYEIPRCFQNVPRLLEGVTIPEKTVYRDDLEETVLWHEHHKTGALRNNHTCQSQKPDLASHSAGCGFSFGRGKTSVTRENPNRDASGLFRPSFRDYGNTGHQQSATGFRRYDSSRGCSEGLGFPNPGSNHRATSSYGSYGSNFQQSRSDASQDWRADKLSGNNVDVSGQRQHPNQPFPPNGGRGRGGQEQKPSPPFWPSGGRGQGRG